MLAACTLDRLVAVYLGEVVLAVHLKARSAKDKPTLLAAFERCRVLAVGTLDPVFVPEIVDQEELVLAVRQRWRLRLLRGIAQGIVQCW